MYVVTSEQMRALDDHAIHRIGIPAVALMENAGKAIAEEVLKLCLERGTGRSPGVSVDMGRADLAPAPSTEKDHIFELSRPSPVVEGDVLLPTELVSREHWLIMVGKGNNGGDGVAASRHLRDAGIRVTLLGTGASGAPRGAYAAMIQAANDSGLPIVSADIPSGLDADTGALHVPCIAAAVTVSLAFLKRGLVQSPGSAAAGRVVVRSIGIPSSLCRAHGISTHLLTPHVLRTELGADVARIRAPEGHKGTYGHVLTVGGSRTMSGAGLLASRAALRAGCGLVTWALPASLVLPLSGVAPEVMLAPATAEETGGFWNEASAERVLAIAKTRDVLAVGPGLGRFDGDTAWLRRLWEEWDGPMVVDADALNMLSSASDFSAWKPRPAATVLTPHPGEMSRLLGKPTAELQRDRIGAAAGFATEHGITLVLKGAHTVVASPDGQAYINTTGTSGMATGGTGDVLTGIIASLLAQGYAGPAAAALGVWLHGRAGERAARYRGHPASVIAGDVIDAL